MIFFIAMTSIVKCLFARKTPMKVADEPEKLPLDEADEEAKLDDRTDVKDLVEAPHNIVESGSGRNNEEEENLKAAG